MIEDFDKEFTTVILGGGPEALMFFVNAIRKKKYPSSLSNPLLTLKKSTL